MLQRRWEFELCRTSLAAHAKNAHGIIAWKFHCMQGMQKILASTEIITSLQIADSISFATIAFNDFHESMEWFTWVHGMISISTWNCCHGYMDIFHCIEGMQKLHASMEIVSALHIAVSIFSALHIAVSISFATIAF